MLFRQFFDPKLAQHAYLVGCQATGEALLIDPERDIDQYLEAAEDEGLRITAVAETHIHADFLSGARELAHRLGTRVYLSREGGQDWQYGWAEEYDAVLVGDGDTFDIGNIRIQVVHTPGHTPEHVSYLVVDRGAGATTPMGIATGDFVFVGSLGRPDLLEQAAGMHGVQEDSARTLYRSLPAFTGLEEHLQVWPAHGAGSTCGKGLAAVPLTTVGYEKRYNSTLASASDGEDAFVRALLEGQPEPQMYFGRMKRDNRAGPPLLGALPRPRRLTADELAAVADRGEATIIDTRLDRSAFMARHIPGALYAPLNRTFNTVVGSLVVEETRPLVLIVDDDDLEEAVRDLVRIGHDEIPAFAEPATLHRYLGRGAPSGRIAEVGFGQVESLRTEPGTVVLDVRYGSEYREGHVPGAVNAPYTRLPEYLDRRVPAGKTLVVHCASGARSAVASAYLAASGRDVRYVNGEWSAWEAEGPVEEGASVPAGTI